MKLKCVCVCACACACVCSASTQEEAEDDSDLSDYGDEPDVRKDALAEPCFMLIGEIFELRGSESHRWLHSSYLLQGGRA